MLNYITDGIAKFIVLNSIDDYLHNRNLSRLGLILGFEIGILS